MAQQKGAIAVSGIDAPALTDYAGTCGLLLAKAAPAPAAHP